MTAKNNLQQYGNDGINIVWGFKMAAKLNDYIYVNTEIAVLKISLLTEMNMNFLQAFQHTLTISILKC